MLRKDVCLMLHYYLALGFSKTAISQRLGIDRRTAHRYAAAGE